MMPAVTWFDGIRFREGMLKSGARGPRLVSQPGPPRSGRAGVVTGRFTDHHVHLQLADRARWDPTRVGRVIDLGSDPAHLPRIPQVEVRFAGAFLTAPGGYPSDRAWAPRGSVRELTGPSDAARAVAEMADAGASCIKVAANSSAGPVLTDALIRTVVARAASLRLPVVAHAEGPGQAQRMARLGPARLAHAPFSERLDEEEIRAQAARMSWVSTLTIHGGVARARALDNTRRFVAAGGELRFGTDLGNDQAPVDPLTAELDALREAGLSGSRLMRALAPIDPRIPETPLLFLPDADPLRARPLTDADLED